MTAPSAALPLSGQRRSNSEIVRSSLARRYGAERRFRLYGILAIAIALTFLVVLFASIIGNGYTAFWQTHIRLDVTLDAATIDPDGTRDPDKLAAADYPGLIKAALSEAVPEATSRQAKRKLHGLVSQGGGYELARMVQADPGLIGRRISLWLPASDDVDMLVKGHIPRDVPEDHRRVSNDEIAWLDGMAAKGDVERRFNVGFFTNGDSREPELAGIWGRRWARS